MKNGITIEVSFLEQLLNCLSDQKKLHELPEIDRLQYQKVIDNVWKQGMSVLNHYRQKKQDLILNSKKNQPFSIKESQDPQNDLFSIF